MGPGAAKQYSMLARRPMLWHAIRAVCVPSVTTVFVVLARDDAQFARADWSAFGEKMQPLYCGGETRRDSVYNGLVAATSTADADDWILVHDAARPCLPSTDLEKLLAEGAGDPVGAILALPAADTAKIAATDEAGVPRIAGTQDRSYVWLAPTPQMFRCGLLMRAVAAAAGAPKRGGCFAAGYSCARSPRRRARPTKFPRSRWSACGRAWSPAAVKT